MQTALTAPQKAALRVIDREGAATIGFKTSPRQHTVAASPARALVKAGLCITYASGKHGETYITRAR